MAFTLKWYAGNINTASSLEKLQEKKGKLEKLCEQTVIATNKHIMFPLKVGIVIKMSKKRWMKFKERCAMGNQKGKFRLKADIISILLLIYAVLLFFLSFRVPLSLTGVLGLIPVIGSSLKWGLYGGIISFLWVAGVVIISYVLHGGNIISVSVSLFVYFLIGTVLGKGIDVFRIQQLELKKNEEEQKILLDNIETQIWYLKDEKTYGLVNRAHVDFVGVQKEDFENKSLYDLMATREEAEIRIADNKDVFSKKQKLHSEEMVLNGKGEPRLLSITKTPKLDDNNNVEYVVCSAKDITEHKRFEQELSRSEERYRLLVNNATEAIVIAQDGMHKFVNPAAVEFYGCSEETLTSTPFLEFVHPEDKELLQENYRKRINREVLQDKYSFRIIAADGSIKWAEVSTAAVEWEGRHAALNIINDITERKQLEEKIYYLSYHDHLTGLYNRHYLENEMQRLDTERQLPISIIMADLNGLKMLNDTFGHEVGDEMLKRAAEILNNSCRSEDIIARWGGDEFVIFLPQTTEEDAKAICQRIDEKCKTAYVEDIPLSMALGTAIKNNTNEDLAKILTKAEENMYKQKLTERQSINSAMLNTLLKNLEAKSFETEAHYSGMQNVAQKIGKKIGLSLAELNRVEMLISLHDIGEINIPGEILNKKGPLTAEEWEIIKKHPETGHRIAHATKELAYLAEDLLAHHERWDGSGYPQGLKGKEIPLLARITAIADAYEVMSSGRPYKKAMSREEVVAELKRCAGAQFDPELVEIFLAVLEE